jgi:hypothetical protein
MSAVELAVPEPSIEVIPFSVRLAARLSTAAAGGTAAPVTATPDTMAPGSASSDDRRSYPRRAGSEIEWLRGVRLKAGPEVSLVDISRGGALVEADVQLRPGAHSALEIVSIASGIEIPFEVLRCQIASLRTGVRYRGACAFKQPFDLERIEQLARETLKERDALPARAPWQKIVVRCRDGALQKGYTLDFSPARGHFSLWPTIQAPVSERSLVPLARLKAVFFVRDFAGNPAYVEKQVPEAGGSGRRVEVNFLDREVLRGRTLNYRPDAVGFFLIPEDSASNNERVFVVSSAVRHVRFR